MALRGLIEAERGDERSWTAAAATLEQAARRFPGHLYETTMARILVVLGRAAEAAALLDLLLPQTLAASGPR